MRTLLTFGVVAVAVNLASATTLRELSLDDMIRQSTAIVRGQVQLTGAATRSGYIYTHYKVQVLEQLKGVPAQQMDVAVPGGVLDGVRQMIAGAPTLVSGQEYVLYLWTSRSGLTQVIGLSQGLFVSTNGMLSRPATAERMVNAAGAETTPAGIQMTLPAMRSRIASVLKERAAAQ